jgi:hypothetical protein
MTWRTCHLIDSSSRSTTPLSTHSSTSSIKRINASHEQRGSALNQSLLRINCQFFSPDVIRNDSFYTSTDWLRKHVLPFVVIVGRKKKLFAKVRVIKTLLTGPDNTMVYKQQGWKPMGSTVVYICTFCTVHVSVGVSARRCNPFCLSLQGAPKRLHSNVLAH